MRTSSSRRTRCRRASSTRATPTPTSCSRPRGSSPTAAGVEDWSFSFQSESPTGEPWLGPDILDHLDGAAAHAACEDVLVCPVGFVSDHLEIRWDIDTEAQEQGARARHAARPDRDAERRPALRPRARARSCAARSPRWRHERAGRIVVDRVSRTLPRLPEGAADAEGRLRLARPPRRARGAGAARRLADGRAGRGGRPRRPQRLGQDDAAAARLGDHQADLGPRRGRRPRSPRCSSSAPASIPTSPAARTST